MYQLAQVVTATEKFAFQQPPNTGNEGAFCVDNDKLFHTWGPATKNVRSPRVVRRAVQSCRGPKPRVGRVAQW